MRLVRVAVACAAALVASACASHGGETSSGEDREGPEPADIAKRIVTQCARIREGELVLVWGGPKDARLVEDIAVEIRKVGALPLVQYESERMDRRMYSDVPAHWDAQSPKWNLRLAEIADAEIAVAYSETEDLFADVPPERIAAQARASLPVIDTLLRRGVRQVYLGNDLRPTADRARHFGVSVDELAHFYRAGLDVDLGALQATGERLCRTFDGGSEVRVTDANGTDLRFQVTGRRAFTSDGVVSDEDRTRGGAALMAWLPAGEAYVTPVPGTAEGRIVVDRDTWQGSEIRNVVLTIRAGRLTNIEAGSGGDRLLADYKAGGDGKDLFGGVDVGFNPGLTSPPGGVKSYAVLGNVTLILGANTWAGGDNNCDFAFNSSLPAATLTVDGKAIVEGGQLVR